MRCRRLLPLLLVIIATSACAATALSPAQMSQERNPRIMGIITKDGRTVRFNRQQDTITWRDDSLRVASPDTVLIFKRNDIRSVLVDKGSSKRLVGFGIPVVLFGAFLAYFWNVTWT
ncbi:MAG TPA: hypothetical protein VF035_04305 [Longimicrobiales bacterium]